MIRRFQYLAAVARGRHRGLRRGWSHGRSGVLVAASAFHSLPLATYQTENYDENGYTFYSEINVVEQK